MSTTRSVASNTAVQVGGSLAGLLVSAGSVVLMTRYLGPGRYGEYNLAWIFLSFFSTIGDLGLVAVSVREMASRPEETEHILGNVLTFRLLVSFGIVACACGVGFLLPYSSEVHVAIVVLAIAVVIGLVNSALVAVLRARLKMQYWVVANTIGSLAGLGALTVVVALNFGFYAVLATSSVAAAITLAITAGFVRRMVPVRLLLNTSTWRRFLQATVLLGTALAVNQVYFQADTLLLSWYRSYSEVGLYTLSGKIVMIVLSLSGFFVASVFPVLSRYASSDDPRVRPVLQTAFDVLAAVSLPLSVGGAILAPQVIGLAGGQRFAGAVLPLRVLFGALMFTFVNGLLGYALVAKNKLSALLKLALWSLAFNVLLNIVIIPRYGVVGAAATTTLSEAIVFAVAYVLIRRSFGFGLSFKNVLRAAAAAAGMGVGVYFARSLTWLVVVPVGAAVYVALLAALGGLERTVLGQIRRVTPG